MKKVKYLVINLPDSEKRRSCIMEQAVRHGITIEVVEAVSGRTLTDEQKAMYLPRERGKIFTRQLSNNEQACVHSHRKALELFLESDAEYCVVLEDDALLDEKFVPGVHYLIDKIGGWECARLHSIGCKRYPLLELPADAPVQVMFPRNNTCMNVGYLHTRKSAEVLLAQSRTFCMEADYLWGRILTEQEIPTLATYPNLVQLAPGYAAESDIDKDAPRFTSKSARRSLLQYLRFRFYRMSFTRAKMRLLDLTRRALYTK